MNKYSAKRTWSPICERWFASKAECDRGDVLFLMQKAGQIEGLEFQPKFVLGTDPSRVTITLDFYYLRRVEPMGVIPIYEDVKGVLTRDFRSKLTWLKQKYDIDVELIR